MKGTYPPSSASTTKVPNFRQAKILSCLWGEIVLSDVGNIFHEKMLLNVNFLAADNLDDASEPQFEKVGTAILYHAVSLESFRF